MPEYQRTPHVDFDDIPGDLPQSSVPQDADLKSIAQQVVTKLNDLRQDDLAPNMIWRDLLALTDSFRTFYSPATVFKTLSKLSERNKVSSFRIEEEHEPRISGSFNRLSWLDVDFVFTAEQGSLARKCKGTVSVAFDAKDSSWKIWMLRTWLECFDGHGHPDLIREIDPHQNLPSEGKGRVMNGTPNGANGRTKVDYGAIVIGGGQTGLATGGRLHALGISYVVLDKRSAVGDSWGTRYESLRWHTAKVYGSLPFENTFPETEDKFVPIKRIQAAYQRWAKRFNINVMTGTSVESAEWNEATAIWTIKASNSSGQISLTAKNVVLAIGAGMVELKYPSWATADMVKASGYKGTIFHSYDGYHSAHQWAGKRGVVVGTANTAHDVAADMANAKMDTTMIQRSPTFVLPAEWLVAAQEMHYNYKHDPADADRANMTQPTKIVRQIVNQAVHGLIKLNPTRFDNLEAAGFKLDRYGDVYTNVYVRLGGHYIDIGASDRIAKGEIKVETKAVKCLTEDGLLFDDGSEIGADVIALCTGFKNDLRNDASKIFGQDVTDQIDDFWGLNKEGEIRGFARPSGHPHLYYQGGDVSVARFYSRFSALQIQADLLGSPMQPYLES